MQEIKLTLNKIKETKNKIVYGTEDGNIIQSVYVEKEALGNEPPERLSITINPQ